MTTKWENFVKRRNISLDKFLSLNDIKSKVDFISHLIKIGVEPPDESFINSIFPPPSPVVERVENFPTQHAESSSSEKPVKHKSNTNVKK